MAARPTACEELTDLLANPRFRLDRRRWGDHLRSCPRCREKLDGALALQHAFVRAKILDESPRAARGLDVLHRAIGEVRAILARRRR